MTATTPFEESSMKQFRSSLRGEILRPSDAGYDEARRVWNGMIDRRPGLIVRCHGVDDVVGAVRFARTNGITVAVRGGGHSAAGLGVCDAGVVIDLSPMREVRVDAARRVARAQGGATWADLDRATQAHGLATTGGVISTTGIGGLTLGGGLGWLMRRFGLACDNVVSVEIVTADGEVRTASARENADLFWGVRGGGGNFGVVTNFEYRLHPVTEVLGGLLVHPAARAREVLRHYRDFTRSAPDELAIFAGLMTSPEGVPIVALIVAYSGEIAEGERILAPLRQFGPPVADQVTRMPYLQLQSMLDPGFPPGLQVYWRSDFLESLSDGAIDTIVDHFETITSPLSALLIEHFGGAVRRVDRNETAFAQRDAEYNFAIIARWADPSEAARHTSWARSISESIKPYASGGVYVNYLGVEEGEDRVREAYGAEKYARLAALKKKYDPENLFRINQNIRPAT